MTKSKKITNLKIGELPTLKVIPISKAIFHEEPDKGRLLNLVDRFGTEGVLKNPPIVAGMKNKKNYVILDGANRVTALIKHGFKHVLVQVVDFEDQFLRLHCWHHAVEKLDCEYFLNKIKQFPDIEITLNENNDIDDEHDLEAVNSNGFLCRMYFSDGRSAMARNGGDIP